MVNTTLQYFDWQPLHDHEKPYEILRPESTFSFANIPRSNLTFKGKAVIVHDIRGKDQEFHLDRNGFQYLEHKTQIRNFKCREQILANYLPETEALIRKCLLGSVDRIFIFNWKIRESMSLVKFSQKNVNLRDGLDPLPPSPYVHVDQSATSANKLVRMHMGEDAEKLLRGRVRIINVWRPIYNVKTWPLAVCDANSVQEEDLVTCDVVRKDFVTETCYAKYNPSHRWLYLSDQTADEVLVFKISDSAADIPAKFCLHASFQTTNEESSVGKRESIEVRALVFASLEQ